MSRYVTYVPIQPYLKQWVTFHYGDPVKFPDASVENAAIRVCLTTLRGRDPILPGENKVAIQVPDSKAKPAEFFNHLTEEGQHCIREMIHNLFRIQLWNDFFPLIDPQDGKNVSHMPILSMVRNWCVENGINQDYDYTIKMKWQRMREAHFFPMKVKSANIKA